MLRELQPGALLELKPSGGRVQVLRRFREGGEAITYEGVGESGIPLCIKQFKSSVCQRDLQGRTAYLMAQKTSGCCSVLHAPLGSFESKGCLGEVSVLFRGSQDLSTILYSQDQLLLTDRLAIAAQLAHGMGDFERADIVHGDLSAGNVLVRRCSKGSWKVKIIDFTMSFVAKGESSISTPSVLGTGIYLAPELRKQGVSAKSLCSDRFSLAVLMHELLCYYPYQDLTGQDLEDALKIPYKRPTKSPDGAAYDVKALDRDIIKLFKSGIHPNGKRRPSADTWQEKLLVGAYSIRCCTKCFSQVVSDPSRRKKKCDQCGKTAPLLKLVTNTGVDISLKQPVLSIGRTLLRADRQVSRNQVIIYRCATGEYFVEAAAGAAASYVGNGNGGWKKLTDTTPLYPGSMLRFGDIEASIVTS